MKFDCGPTWEEEKAAKEEWHEWFAWWPVWVGSHDCRWLEVVMRKGKYSCDWNDCGWDWKYQAREANDD